jgi:hypothetical protein
MPREDWELGSGFADDFDFHVERAYFGFRDNYMGGQVPLLIWEGSSPDAEDVTEVAFPIGSGWNVVGNGARIEHESGRKKIIRNSVYGHLINRVVNELKVESVLEGSPLEAKTWEGYTWHLKREKIEYPGLKRDDKEGVATERLMPVALVKDKTGAKAASKGAQKESAPSANGPVGDGDLDIPAALKAKLIALAKKHDRGEFQVKALELDEVVANDALMNAILDDGPAGWWARYHG